MADQLKPLDATDQTQITVALGNWITSNSIFPGPLLLEYLDDIGSFCIKCDGGAITEEDVLGNFSAEVQFSIYYLSNAVPDSAGEIFKPLNDLIAWLRKNGTSGLDLGSRRSNAQITTLKAPTDLNGPDEDGNTTFFAVFSLTYDEDTE